MSDNLPALPLEVTPSETKYGNNGMQYVFKFDNGYGASIVQNPYSYGGREGKYELAVLDFHASEEGKLTYDTPITNDVIGWLDIEDIAALLLRIKSL